MSRSSTRRLPVGAEAQPDGVDVRVWAPDPATVSLVIERHGQLEEIRMSSEEEGYYSTSVSDVTPGTRYWFRVDGELLPDPASRYQPEGPSGASVVVDPHGFGWTDSGWRGATPTDAHVLYEMHVGAFTCEGTWRAAMTRLPLLRQIGITMLEVMPISEFPGRFGWGYDGVFPYAPTRLYGEPDDFRAFVDAAHGLGLAVILDVVYNHLGPDGCVFRKYSSRYFTNRYANEWGEALNFDEHEAAPAREYWAANAAYWIDEFHLDGLRLDATQSIHDPSREHILATITRRARAAAGARSIVLIAENEPQQVRLVTSPSTGGFGIDALWNDDFHHSAVVALTGRAEAYYSDHHGSPQEFVSAAKYGYLFQGQRYAWQRQPRGTSTRGLPPTAFVNFIENHDQLANSGFGTRLRQQTSPGRYRAMTAVCLLMPGTPMLFMGQEFGATTPFAFFADHKADLAAAVTRGRAEFVSQFPSLASTEFQTRMPAPHDPETFERCKLDWREHDAHAAHRRLYADLIALRRSTPSLRPTTAGAVDGAVLSAQAFVLRYFDASPGGERLLIVNLGVDIVSGGFPEPLLAPPTGHEWAIEWASTHPDYGGCGTPDVVSADGWHIPGEAAVVLRPTERGDGGTRSDGR